MNTTVLAIIVIVAAAGLSVAATTNVLVPAFAAGHTPQNGFGKASKDLATNCPPGTYGQHASSFPTPRSGIGNVAKDNGLTVSQLGQALDSNGPPC